MHRPPNTERVLQLFFTHPTREFYLREISRLTKLSPPAVKPRLDQLKAKGIFITVKRGPFMTWKAAIEDQSFKRLKATKTANTIIESGLLELIDKKCHPEAIILFGSASRGEDTESSDIDLAIVGEETKIDSKPFEARFNRKISLLFIPNFSGVSKELKNNIINGKILMGYLKVF